MPNSAIDQYAPGGLPSVTAAEIIRNFGHWQHKALEAPLAITHHGRARVMLISVEDYERLAASKPRTANGDPIELLHFIDNTAEGFIAHDANLRVTFLNKVAEDYYGRHRAEMVGFRMDAADPNAGDDYVTSMWLQVLKTGESVSYETESRLFPGRRISVRSFPYKDGVGTLFVNITERERLRAKAEQSKSFAAAIRANRSVATAMLDVRGRVDSADSVFPDLLGFTAEDLKNTRLTTCIAPHDRRRAEQFFEDMWPDGQGGVITVGMIVKSGETQTFKIAAVPMMRDYVQKSLMLMITTAADASAG